jgi:hypothetical protein
MQLIFENQRAQLDRLNQELRADQRGRFIYIGGQAEYQQYERLLRETWVAETRLPAAAAPDQPWRGWRWTWKPWKLLVWSYEPGNL